MDHLKKLGGMQNLIWLVNKRKQPNVLAKGGEVMMVKEGHVYIIFLFH